jgi:hypothetical protein
LNAVFDGMAVTIAVTMTAVIAAGTDKYSVLYSLAEVDPSIHTGDVLIADMMDGQKLGKDGTSSWSQPKRSALPVG